MDRRPFVKEAKSKNVIEQLKRLQGRSGRVGRYARERILSGDRKSVV